MRVPLIIRDPSAQADATRGSLLPGFAESIDLAPTMFEWLGEQIPERVQGTSLLGRLHDRPGALPKREAHFEFSFRNRFRNDPSVDSDQCLLWVLRDDAVKYVHFAREDMPPMLFDLRNDPEEQHDVAGDSAYAPVLAEYAGRMLRWRMKHEDQRMERWADRLR
jgi:arylsulfatase A-like enzyme